MPRGTLPPRPGIFRVGVVAGFSSTGGEVPAKRNHSCHRASICAVCPLIQPMFCFCACPFPPLFCLSSVSFIATLRLFLATFWSHMTGLGSDGYRNGHGRKKKIRPRSGVKKKDTGEKLMGQMQFFWVCCLKLRTPEKNGGSKADTYSGNGQFWPCGFRRPPGG